LKKEVYFRYQSTDLKRLDFFLAQELKNLDISREQIRKSIKKKTIKINQKTVSKSSFLLSYGDLISGEIELRINLKQVQPQKIDFKIIYQDDFLAVIDKPAGLTVHPSDNQKENTLVNGLIYRFKQENLSDFQQDHLRPGIVHRLDKNTSGLIIVAKNAQTHANLSEQLKQRTLSRIYWLITAQVIKENSGIIESQICRHPKDRKKMFAFSEKQNNLKNLPQKHKYAKTLWRKLEDLVDRFSLLEARLETGRTHQIRVHFNFINKPLLGDRIYGKQSRLINRQCLHAKKIKFVHPFYQKELSFESDLPEDFKKIIMETNPKSSFI